MANAIVSQSGGPTGVINASLVGVIEEAVKHSEIDNLYGAVHAVAGIVKEDFVDLKKLSMERARFEPKQKQRIKSLEFQQAEIRMARLKRQIKIKIIIFLYN